MLLRSRRLEVARLLGEEPIIHIDRSQRRSSLQSAVHSPLERIDALLQLKLLTQILNLGLPPPCLTLTVPVASAA